MTQKYMRALSLLLPYTSKALISFLSQTTANRDNMAGVCNRHYRNSNIVVKQRPDTHDRFFGINWKTVWGVSFRDQSFLVIKMTETPRYHAFSPFLDLHSFYPHFSSTRFSRHAVFHIHRQF